MDPHAEPAPELDFIECLAVLPHLRTSSCLVYIYRHSLLGKTAGLSRLNVQYHSRQHETHSNGSQSTSHSSPVV